MLTFLIAFVLLRIWDLAAIVTTYFTKSTILCSSRHIQTAGFIFIIVMVSTDYVEACYPNAESEVPNSA